LSANQSITSGVATPVTFDIEDSDADNQHYTSAAVLSAGTVAKAAGTQTLTGTGTVFLADLSVGQVISVPGTAIEKAVVTNIASNTSLTVARPFANTASAQVCTRVNSAGVFRTPGSYSAKFGAYMAALASGTLQLQIKLNDTTVIAQVDPTPINASAGYQINTLSYPFQQWDFIEAIVTQTSGGAVNLTADARTHFEINARPTIIVSAPFVKVHETYSSGTSVGQSTIGSYLKRALNAIESDTAGLASLSSNQVVLSAGTYEFEAEAFGYAIDGHKLRLFNATDSVSIETGVSAYARASNSVANLATVKGKFVLSGSKALELQHRIETANSTNGWGRPTTFGDVEAFSNIVFKKVG
jgi:hypothetical protein